MIVGSRDYVLQRYKLHKLKEIEDMVADAVEVVSHDFATALIFLRCGLFYFLGFRMA